MPCKLTHVAFLGSLLALVSDSGVCGAATLSAPISAAAIKPLTLTKVQDLDLGSVTLGPGSWTNARIALAQNGTFTCATSNLICSGLTLVAKYKVSGSNQQTVHISCPNVSLVNQNDPTQTLVLAPDAPSSVVLTNSGSPGLEFSIGGSVSLSSTTAAGTYVGTFNVTVDY